MTGPSGIHPGGGLDDRADAEQVIHLLETTEVEQLSLDTTSRSGMKLGRERTGDDVVKWLMERVATRSFAPAEADHRSLGKSAWPAQDGTGD